MLLVLLRLGSFLSLVLVGDDVNVSLGRCLPLFFQIIKLFLVVDQALNWWRLACNRRLVIQVFLVIDRLLCRSVIALSNLFVG